MNLKYKREGFAQTRDAITWVMLSAPKFKFGLTLDDVFAGLEHGYQSVLPLLKDDERRKQWEDSLQQLRLARELFAAGDVHEGKRTMQKAEELFASLRRVGGVTPSPQALAESETGANEVDE